MAHLLRVFSLLQDEQTHKLEKVASEKNSCGLELNGGKKKKKLNPESGPKEDEEKE